jgi:hypothetical protein
MAGVKMSGKFAHQIEWADAVGSFWREWMPYTAPSDVSESWKMFVVGLHDTHWISDWQMKNWVTPKFW